MAKGPHEAKLAEYVSEARLHSVREAQAVWTKGAQVLDDLAAALDKAKPHLMHRFGPETGPAAVAAFDKVRQNVLDQTKEMHHASKALSDAGDALDHGQKVHDSLAGSELGPAPQDPVRTATESDAHYAKRQQATSQDQHAYSGAYHDRETKAQKAMQVMDTHYESATQVMESIHGRPRATTGGGGGTGGTGTGGGSLPPRSGTVPSGGGHHHSGTPGPTVVIGDPGYVDEGPHHTVHPPYYPPYDPNGGGDGGNPPITDYPGGGYQHPGVPQGPGGYVPGGAPTPVGGVPTDAGTLSGTTSAGPSTLAGGLLGGSVLGGASLTGSTGLSGVAVRGGLTSSSGTLGATSRTAARGTLGAAEGEEGAAGSGRGSSRGAGAGGSGAGGRGGKKDKRGRKKGEFFEDDEDWLDDDEAAPPVLG